jgi:hypothetical protein
MADDSEDDHQTAENRLNSVRQDLDDMENDFHEKIENLDADDVDAVDSESELPGHEDRDRLKQSTFLAAQKEVGNLFLETARLMMNCMETTMDFVAARFVCYCFVLLSNY